jgi:hypothetical protein
MFLLTPPKIQICPHKIFRKTFFKYSQFSESIFQNKLECFIFSKSETRLLETKTRTLETKTLVSSSYSITQNLCSSSHRKLFFLSRAKTLILQSDQNPSLKILKYALKPFANASMLIVDPEITKKRNTSHKG